MSRHVAQYRQSLENSEIIAVMIYDCWDPSVGGVFCEPGLFLYILADVDCLVDERFSVGGFELFEEDGGFVPVWRAPGENCG